MKAQRIFLKKNIAIGFREWGPEDGTPLIFFHGFPGSSMQGAMFAEVCEELKLRVLSIDRMGYGQTSSAMGFDIYKLFIERMELKQFYIFGVSGGAPSAVTLSEMFSDRVLGLGIICGLIPLYNNENRFPARHRLALKSLAPLPTPLLNGIMSVLDVPRLRDTFMTKLVDNLPEVDKRLFKREDLVELLKESILDSRQQGVEGIVRDIQYYGSDWMNNSRKYNGPVWIWHGDQDTILPVTMADAWKNIYPESSFKIIPKQGHYSLAVDVMPSELKTIFQSPP